MFAININLLFSCCDRFGEVPNFEHLHKWFLILMIALKSRLFAMWNSMRIWNWSPKQKYGFNIQCQRIDVMRFRFMFIHTGNNAPTIKKTSDWVLCRFSPHFCGTNQWGKYNHFINFQFNYSYHHNNQMTIIVLLQVDHGEYNRFLRWFQHKDYIVYI